MIRLISIVCAFGMFLLIHADGRAQRDLEGEELELLRQEIEKLHTGQERLQKELGEIKKLLTRGRRRRPTPREIEPTVVDISRDPVKGKHDARLTMLDFTDYQ